MIELKKQNLNHLDIKPCNILLNDLGGYEYEIKLSDFGTSK